MALRELADLPYVAALTPHSGGLAADGKYDTVRFSELTFDQPRARNAKFLECAFTQVSFHGGQLRGARFGDVWLRDVRLTRDDLAGRDDHRGSRRGGLRVRGTVAQGYLPRMQARLGEFPWRLARRGQFR